MGAFISFIMPLASGKGTSSSAASRGLDAQQEAQRILKFNQPVSPSSPAPSKPPNSGGGSGAPTRTSPVMTGNPTPTQEAARLSQLISDRRRIPDSLSNASDEPESSYGEPEDMDDSYGEDSALSDDSVPPEQAPSVTDVGGIGDPFAEDVSMRQKMEDANQRLAQAVGKPGTTNPGLGASKEGTQTSSSSNSTGSGRKTSALERGRESLGQEYGRFQRDLQATKRRDDAANKDKLKALKANKGSQTLQQVNMLKERYTKIRDLLSIGTGVGVAYYVAKLDITIANRYFLKRRYLWGYRDQQEYAGNKMLRLNDNLDLVEWLAWAFVRVVMMITPIIIIFTWVILPILVANHAVNNIFGPRLGGYLLRIIH